VNDRAPEEAFPQEILAFLDANIESVEQLEILRLLSINRGRSWSVAALARQVQTSPRLMAGHLATLEARGLLTVRKQGAPVYLFGSSTPESARMLNDLLQCYNERPVSMIKRIYSRPPPASGQ
jgi:predicted ArsR family transcriptional regulator